ncbi:MAG: cupin domain-containing protein [Chloroflexi bacterium]|jgi:quercetin dioxygenase-like cupin family protein|nr:cupin domain-containing protein [Chloroflexota bacterium]GIW09921.1 MAG: hypothetical protein KatS3mg061_0978 [Dehalococcoidia bacterium]
MNAVRHAEMPWEEWRPGVLTRVWMAAPFGARQMHAIEQLVDPGLGAPRHWHYAEEHLTILEGRAEVFVEEEVEVFERGATVLFPSRSWHGFRNVGDGRLHVLGVFSWPVHETFFENAPPGVAIREYDAVDGGTRRRLIPEYL